MLKTMFVYLFVFIWALPSISVFLINNTNLYRDQKLLLWRFMIHRSNVTGKAKLQTISFMYFLVRYKLECPKIIDVDKELTNWNQEMGFFW